MKSYITVEFLYFYEYRIYGARFQFLICGGNLSGRLFWELQPEIEIALLSDAFDFFELTIVFFGRLSGGICKGVLGVIILRKSAKTLSEKRVVA